MRPRHLLILLPLAGWIPAAAAQEPPVQDAPGPVLTLEDAVSLGLTHAFGARIAAFQEEAARAGVGETRVRFLPDFSADVSKNANSRTLNPDFVPPEGQTVDDLKLDFYSDSLEASVGASYVLFSTTRRLDLQAAKLNVEARSALAETAKRAVVRDVAVTYLRVLEADALLRLAEEHLARRQRLLEETRAMVSAGKRAEYETIRSEAELAVAEASLVEARNGVRLARSTLAQVVGRELPLDFVADPPAPPVDPRGDSPGSRSDLAAEAIAQRAEVRAAEADARAARIGVSRANRQFLPTLSIFGRYNRLLDASRADPFDQFLSYGGQLEIRFSDKLANVYRTRAARAESRLAKVISDQTRVAVSLDIERASLETDRSMERLAALQKSLDAAKRNYESTAERYRLGVASQTERVDAEAALVEAEVNELEADIAYRIAVWNLRYEIGESFEVL